MTLLLAVETATRRCSVAIGDEDGVLASSSLDQDRRHVEALAPAITAACRTASVTLDDLAGLVVDTGPGLFTGMRVGIAAAQGLAVALGLRVHPVCSLDVLAHPHRHASRPVAAVVDARRGEVFRSLLREGLEVAGPRCTSPEALAEELAHGGPWLAVGDGAARHQAVLEAGGEVEVLDELPSAAAALEMALAEVAAGSPGLDPGEVEARYLRAPDARANFAVLIAPAAAPFGLAADEAAS